MSKLLKYDCFSDNSGIDFGLIKPRVFRDKSYAAVIYNHSQLINLSRGLHNQLKQIFELDRLVSISLYYIRKTVGKSDSKSILLRYKRVTRKEYAITRRIWNVNLTYELNFCSMSQTVNDCIWKSQENGVNTSHLKSCIPNGIIIILCGWHSCWFKDVDVDGIEFQRWHPYKSI